MSILRKNQLCHIKHMQIETRLTTQTISSFFVNCSCGYSGYICHCFTCRYRFGNVVKLLAHLQPVRCT